MDESAVSSLFKINVGNQKALLPSLPILGEISVLSVMRIEESAKKDQPPGPPVPRNNTRFIDGAKTNRTRDLGTWATS